MSFILSIGARARPSLNQDPVSGASTSPPAQHGEAALPLPRHVLVALAGIAADVTSLRQRFVDDAQLHDPLDNILGRIDGLVDSIYDRAADPGEHPLDASSGHGSAIIADHPAAAVPAESGEHRDSGTSPEGVGRPIVEHQS